jgi:hypothetical protein
VSTFNSKYLRFDKPTGTGAQTVTGVGFRGKALILWTTFQAAAGATTAATFSMGMTDGILQSVRFIHHPGGEATTTSAQSERTDRIAWKTNATSGADPTVQVEGEFTGWTDDGFTLDWAVNDGAAAVIHAIVLGGDIAAKFTQVKVDINAGETMDVTGVGFRPTSFIIMGGAADEFGAGDYTLGAPWGSVHGFGFSNVTDNVCGWTLGRGTAGAADCYCGQATDLAASVRLANLSGATALMEMRIADRLPDGFTISRVTGSVIEPVQHILCLRGVQAALGSFTAPLTATTKSLALPFQPDLMILQSMGTPASTSQAGMAMGIGAWERSGGECGGTWIGGVDAANPSVYRRSTFEDLIIETRNASSGAAVMQATVDSTAEDEAVFDFSAVSGSADEILYLALAAADPVVGAFVGGYKGTVGASRAVLWSLDGNTNFHGTEGEHKICGDSKVTGKSDLPMIVVRDADPSAPVDGTFWLLATGTPVELALKVRLAGVTHTIPLATIP